MNGNKLSAKEWKTLVSMQLEEAIKHLDDLINWNADDNKTRIFFDLHISKD